MMDKNHPKDRIGLFFCGPPPLAESLKEESLKYDGKFQIYKENF